MKIHEFQAKELMQERGIRVPQGEMVTTVADAVAAVGPLVEATGNPVVVVKSSVVRHPMNECPGRLYSELPAPGCSRVTTCHGKS